MVEEVLRIYGYNNVEINTEAHINLSQRTDVDESNDLQQIVAEQLTARGYSEIMNTLSPPSPIMPNRKNSLPKDVSG